MSIKDNIFERFLYEAPDDDPPDMPSDTSSETSSSDPPDIPDDVDINNDNGPPDIGDDTTDTSIDDGPPDIPDDGEFGEDDNFSEDDFNDETSNDIDPNNLELDEKISMIMNMNLYQRYLSLLNNITNQISSIKDNNDILYTISPESIDIGSSLKKLEENIHLYLQNNFMNENYSKNLLFFNKCLNLLKLLNDDFDEKIKHGIKAIK